MYMFACMNIYVSPDLSGAAGGAPSFSSVIAAYIARMFVVC